MVTVSHYLYDKYKRDQEARSFYKSKAWEKVRRLVLIRDNYLCQSCLIDKKIIKADVVHHIKELKDYPELGLEMTNLISWCHSCHNRHHKLGNKTETDIQIPYTEVGANEELT